MKRKYAPFIIALLSVFSLPCTAQDNTLDADAYPMELNTAEHPCLTAEEYTFIEQKCAENIQLLGLDKTDERGTTATALQWPLRAAAGLTDCGFYRVSAGVDHNTASGVVKDYHCGTNTYDGHGGTDLSIWPYSFYKMDNNLVEIIAAAPGTILYKSDGHFDKYCAANTDTANYIIIRHADGSQANYWHMKKNSVTSKTVGQTVAAGEYLGVVGSSGNSSGPHLHFEVWSGSTSATRVDPFAGSCNSLNANSWWASQKPYNKTEVIKVSVNTTDIVIPACPATETPNESSAFPVSFQGAGLPAGYAKFYAFLVYDTNGTNVNLSILNPSGTTFNSWTYSSTAYAKISYRSWSKLLPTTPGIYTFKAEHNGMVCSTTFTVGTPSAVHEMSSPVDFDLYPNPAENILNLNWYQLQAEDITVYGADSKLAMQSQIPDNHMLNISQLASGVYLLVVNTREGAVKKRFVKM